jgi:MFS family permease
MNHVDEKENDEDNDTSTSTDNDWLKQLTIVMRQSASGCNCSCFRRIFPDTSAAVSSIFSGDFDDETQPALYVSQCIFLVLFGLFNYASVYFIRVPAFVASYEGDTVAGTIDLKTAMAIAQLLGFGLGKIPALKYASQLGRERIPGALLVFGVAAVLVQLIFFTLLGSIEVWRPFMQVTSVFVAAFITSPVYGLLVTFFEGRRSSEALLAGFELSYVISGGLAKSGGAVLLETYDISPQWMVSIAALLALPVYIVTLILLSAMPSPSPADVRHRNKRNPASSHERWAFIHRWYPGLIAITLQFIVLSGFRSFRDFFAPEVFRELLGQGNVSPAVYSQSETIVSIATLAVTGAMYRVQDNRRAFFSMLCLMLLGAGGLILFGTMFRHVIGPLPWMITIGVGLFLGYVPPGPMLYDRLMAASHTSHSTIFLVYIMEGTGDLCSMGFMLYKQFGAHTSTYVGFLVTLAYTVATLSIVLISFAILYFHRALAVVHPIAIVASDSGPEYQRVESEAVTVTAADDMTDSVELVRLSLASSGEFEVAHRGLGPHHQHQHHVITNVAQPERQDAL